MPRWPLMSRLVALSVVVHALFLVAVVYVPTLRSMLYVASAVSGLKFVSEDYDASLVGQRATIIQFGPHEKLYYPVDYFGAPAATEVSASDPMMVQQSAPPPPMPVYRPRRMRTPRPVALPQPSPSPEVAQASPSPSPAASPTPDEAAQKLADAEMDRIAKEKGIERPPGNINTKPFEDIALKGKELFDQGKLNFGSAIDVTATAERNDDGTLKQETVVLEGVAGDENMARLAQELVMAMSQSKVLVVLKGAKNVRIVLKLDQQNVSIRVLSELPSEGEAMKTALGCAALVAIGRKAKQGTNEGELYNNLKFDAEGKQFVMAFEMPKDAAGKMIADLLAKKAAASSPAQNKS